MTIGSGPKLTIGVRDASVEGAYAEHSNADLVLHIHRELIHHGAEVALLRDLYAHRS